MAAMVNGAELEKTAIALSVGTKPSTMNSAAPAEAVTSAGYFSQTNIAKSKTTSPSAT